jgi:hypothetical protein
MMWLYIIATLVLPTLGGFIGGIITRPKVPDPEPPKQFTRADRIVALFKELSRTMTPSTAYTCAVQLVDEEERRGKAVTPTNPVLQDYRGT